MTHNTIKKISKESIESLRYDLNKYIVQDYDRDKLYEMSKELDEKINDYIKFCLLSYSK